MSPPLDEQANAPGVQLTRTEKRQIKLTLIENKIKTNTQSVLNIKDIM
jgi:hypothetical protein